MSTLPLPPNLFFAYTGVLCWCPGLDLDNGVDGNNQCRVCRGLVVIIHLEQYRRGGCECTPRPGFDEAHFCLVCKHPQLLAGGEEHPYTRIAIDRAVAMHLRAIMGRRRM